jgi:protocatechuate 3,4-dioxygenase alpha subunit
LDLVPDAHRQFAMRAGEPQTGEVIELVGRVLDGAGAPTPDVLIETWQADPDGRYDAPGFRGLGRAATADDGAFRLRLVKPGRSAGPGNSLQAPHLAIGILGRGLLKRLVTRAYFEGDDGLDEDPVLALVPLERRATLIARREAPGRYRLDIVLQGQDETVFFEF